MYKLNYNSSYFVLGWCGVWRGELFYQ